MKRLVLLICISLFVSSCGKDEGGLYELELNFKVVNDSEDVKIGSTYLNNQNQSYKVSIFQMLVTDIALSSTADSSGTVVAPYHYFDIEDSATHQLIKDVSADAKFIKFTFGATKEKNTNDLLPEDLVYQNFLWNMGGFPGFHYLKFEGKDVDNNNTFAMHAGPLMGMDYSYSVSLPIETEVLNDKLVVTVLVDADKFFSANFKFPLVNSGTVMANAEAQGKIKTNVQNVFSLE